MFQIIKPAQNNACNYSSGDQRLKVGETLDNKRGGAYMEGEMCIFMQSLEKKMVLSAVQTWPMASAVTAMQRITTELPPPLPAGTCTVASHALLTTLPFCQLAEGPGPRIENPQFWGGVTLHARQKKKKKSPDSVPTHRFMHQHSITHAHAHTSVPPC